ncbi:hypothetical protein ASG91_08860 [Phycicoccus sp. Soil802]|nr:hypothetical protein ASG91_08860 [Phycicoccus sp. Soil802]
MMRRIIAVVVACVLLTLGLPVAAQAAGGGATVTGGAIQFRLDTCYEQEGWATICQQVHLVGNFRALPSGSFLITQAVTNTITIKDVVAPGLQESTTTEQYVTQQFASVDSAGRSFETHRTTLSDGHSTCTTTYTVNVVGDTVVVAADPQTRCHS